jgi:hypothetical protein
LFVCSHPAPSFQSLFLPYSSYACLNCFLYITHLFWVRWRCPQRLPWEAIRTSIQSHSIIINFEIELSYSRNPAADQCSRQVIGMQI